VAKAKKKKLPAPPTPTDAVRHEWLRRVEAEYRSAARTQHLTLWLIQIGASPDLVREGMRIADDEMVHAAMSHDVYVEAGGEGGPRLTRESLELHRDEVSAPLEEDVTRTAVEIFCLGETVAVPLFKELREPCSVPVARRALDRVLVDEVRHRDFGWTLLAWLMEHPTLAESLREIVVRGLPTWFQRLRAAYVPLPGRAREDVSAEERAWGLMPVSLYRSSVDKALARDWIPRFSKLDFDAQVAWDEATKRLSK
jgi:hypothetical protein